MFKFLAKVIVGGVGVYVVNNYLQESKALEKVVTVGTQLFQNAMTQIAQAQAAAQRAAQQGGTQ